MIQRKRQKARRRIENKPIMCAKRDKGDYRA
jgi:hypothetical protein